MNTAAISWQNLNNKTKNKQVVFYGFGQDWIFKSLKKINKTPIFIIDNNSAYKNKTYKKIKIISFKEFKKKKLKNILFIITTALINEISNELELEKYKIGIDFFVTPELKDFIYLQNISKYNFKLLFSSSDYPFRFKDRNIIRKSKQGGGLYLFNSKKNNYKKLYSGQVRQFEFYKNKYFLVNHYKKILVVLNKNFKLLKTIKLDQSKEKDIPPNFCGLAISKKKNLICVANSSTDKIYNYSLDNFKLTKIIDFKKINKIKNNVTKFHINDLFFSKDNLFISFFSLRGNYNKKNNVKDGGVISLNLNNFKVKKRINNLTKPHSPVIKDGMLHILDSSSGHLLDEKKMFRKI